MKKKKSSKDKGLTVWQMLLYLSISVLVILLAIFFYTNATKESRDFMSLSQDMQTLQRDFNEIDNGWDYDESCRAEGGVYTRDKPSSCNVRIINSSLTADSKSSIEDYQAALKANKMFEVDQGISNYTVIDTEKGELEGTSIRFYPSYLEESNCELIVYEGGASKSAVATCTATSSNFYFPRSDT